MFQSPYRRGADDGFIFGLYLSAMFFASIFSASAPLLSVLALVMAVAVPVVILRFMLRYDRLMGQAVSFPMFWMHGVVTFFCGTCIAGTLLVIYMKWLSPDFVLNQLRQLAALDGTAPGTFVQQASEMAGQMIEANFIPTPIAIVIEIIMLAIVSGSILSIILGAVLSMRRRAPRPTA